MKSIYLFSWWQLLLIFVSVIILISSCGKESADDASLRRYNIQLINGLTDEPLANVPISMFFGIGGTYLIDQTEGVTDNQGMLTLEMTAAQDSINTLINEASWLEQSNIHQTITLSTNEYVLYELFQDTAKATFRPKLEEDKLIVAKAYEPIINTLRIIDEPPYRERDEYCIYDIFQSHPKFSFKYFASGVGLFRETDPDTTDLFLYLADGVEYNTEFSLVYLTDTLTGALDTFFQSSIQFQADRNLEGEIYEIKF